MATALERHLQRLEQLRQGTGDLPAQKLTKGELGAQRDKQAEALKPKPIVQTPISEFL